MKKYLVLLGAVILVMALASPSLAQFKSYGHVEVGSFWVMDQRFFDNSRGDDNSRYIAERFRFYLEYGDPKTVRAVLGFEGDSKAWGTPSYNQGGYTGASPGGVSSNRFGYTSTPVGGPSLANGNNMGASNTDQLALEIKHAYIDFVVPSTPISVMAGLQFYGVGGARAQFLQSTDLPGVTVTANFAPHAIQAWWAKEKKGNLFKDNDSDYYGARWWLRQKDLTLEVFGLLNLDRRAETEAWTLNGTLRPGTTITDYTVTQTIAARNFEVQPWWLGASASFNLGNFTIEPTAIYLGGKARKYFAPGVTGVTPSDVDYSAYMLDLLLKYQLGPGLSFAVQGFYSSGGDTDKTDKYNKYVYTSSSESGWGFGNDRSVFFFGNGDFQYYGFKQLDFGGLWFGRANVEYSPLAWMKLGVNYLYIGDNSKGTLAVQPLTGATNNQAFGSRTDADKDNVGQEINLIATLKIYQNLTYMIGFGYFLPGDIYKGNTSPGKTDSPADSAWNLMTNLKIAF